ncbi:hypothetical protein L249_6768 [Ophiocordyceps polyrhachis-furcata BCC 54312]|uniref:Uncharacterized protein n=1 Tax=Ophiocordyceps polyrhachis-furcata BCC 54312 TaxID=1330021 RepID=A0A367LKM8_9HYPO|nr:hypothetical protein L249_6768 [Ophiocordyceps polyrhachis-furcata BCC 54312]
MSRHESDLHQSVRHWLHRIDDPGRLSPAMVDDRSPWRPHHLLSQDARPTRLATQSPNLLLRDSPLPSISPSEHHFGKKPRRKTRPHRYDSAKRSPPSNVAEAPSRKRKTDGKRRRLRSDREVMDNFASQAIASDRLTLKPNLRAGSFLNGRSSGPAQPADLAFYHLSIPDQGTREPRRPSNQSKAARDLQDDADFFANVKKKHVVVIGSDRLDSARGTSTSRPASTSRHTTNSQKVVRGRSSVATEPSSVKCPSDSDRAATPVSRRRIPKWHSVEPQNPPLDAHQPIHTGQAYRSYVDKGVMVDARRCIYEDKGVMVSPGLGFRPSSRADRSHDGEKRRSLNPGRVRDAPKPATVQPPSALRGKVYGHQRVPAMPGTRPSTYDGVAQHFAGYGAVDKHQSRTLSESQRRYPWNPVEREPPVQQLRYHATAPQSFEASNAPPSFGASSALQPLERPVPDTTWNRASFTASNWPEDSGLRGAPPSRDDRPRSRRPTCEADESPQELIARLDREAREQVEASSRCDGAYGDGNEFVDRYEVGLQFHEPDAGEAGVRETRLGARADPRDGTKPRTPRPLLKRRWQWDGARDMDAVDWTEFWRPNCFG